MLRADEGDKLLPDRHSFSNGSPGSFTPQGGTRPGLDLWEASKNGDIARVEECIKSGLNTANDRDSQNLTALHWAAIHRHTPIVRLLLDHGADPNTKGGDLEAVGQTPVMWAARSGILDAVSLLCKKGGDPTLYDNQGYNALHLAAHGAHYHTMLFLIVCLKMDIDSLDSMGRTALMWLAYMGLSQDCLDQVLRLKPDINRQDSSGFTALHWAVCTGHWMMAQSLLKAGADISIQDYKEKTVDDWAKEIKKEDEWKAALAAARNKTSKKLPPNQLRIVLFSIPFVVFPLCVFAFSTLPWYFGLLTSAGLLWGMVTIVTNLLGRNAQRDIIKTPFPTAVFQASGYYVVFTWLFWLLPNTSLLISTAFIALWSTAMYQLYRCIFGDPGYVPFYRTEKESQDAISSLVDKNQLNDIMFCSACQVKRPLRSKHCKICDRCIARFDHHCPWTYCCVGSLNHLRFVIFLICFVSCVVLFDVLAMEYYSNLQYPMDTPIPTYFDCNFPTSFCNMLATDSWTFMVALWAGIQLFWCGPLCLYQIYYAVFNTTTYESIRAGTAFPPMKNPYDKGISQNVTAFLNQGRDWFEKFPNTTDDAPRERSLDLV